MQTLATFYKSKEWLALMDVIRASRLNNDGQVICSYCRKPIVKRYDMIGHHKEHLTEENVNDATVSLNTDNIELVHHRCHNFIHNKGLQFGARKVYIVYGAPLSGKTSYVERVKNDNDLVLDIDRLYESITLRSNYFKPKQLSAVVFAMRDTILDCIKYRRGFWNNAYIIGGYPYKAERERLANELSAEYVFIDETQEECLKRLKDNPNGRDEDRWKNFICEWFARYSP